MNKIQRTFKMRLSFLTGLALSLIFSLPGQAISKDKDKQGPLPLVQVSAVSQEKAGQPEKYIGHIEAIVSVDLRVRVEGYLEGVNFEEGSFVKKGELLYIIEQRPYQARVDAALAQVIQARAGLFKAQTRLRRLRSAQPESVPQTELDDAKAAKDLAQGKLQQAEAELKMARIDLDYTTIEAPLSGRIGKSYYKQGDLVSPSSGPLAEIVSIDPIRVIFSVSEKEVETIQKAISDADHKKETQKLEVSLQFPDQSLYPQKGRIEFIDNKMDKDTGTIAIWARFDNPKRKLIPGQYVKVFVQPAKSKLKLAVPQVAVQRDREGDFVYVVNQKDLVEKRKITTGQAVKDKYLVDSGLKQGEMVVVQGLQKATPGKKVKTKVQGEP